MSEAELQAPFPLRLTSPGDEGREHRRTCPPRHVKARQGILATFGPADDGKPAHADRMEPGPFLAGGKLQVRLGPLPRPVIFRSVKTGRAEPVLPGEVQGIVNAEPTLLGGVDEEETTE